MSPVPANVSEVGFEHSDTNTLGEVPQGWVWTTIGQIAEVQTGATPKRGETKYYERGTIPWVTSTLVNENYISESNEYITQAAIDATNAKIFPAGTLILAMYGEGKTRGKISELRIDAATNQACAALLVRGLDDCLRKYLKLFFAFSYENMRSKSAGGVQPNLNLGMVRRTPLPLPPNNEQSRIVTKLDELFSQIDKGEENLKRTQVLVKQYRQSVLKAAVTGELTSDWRKTHGAGAETGEALLQRILTARRAAWEAAELEKMTAKGKPPKDDKWKQKYKEPEAPDTSELLDLPEGWIWATMDHVTEIVGGVTVDARRKVEGASKVPYLRVANVQRGYLDLSEVKEISVSDEVIKKLSLRPGDILFNEGGDLDKLGRGWVWSGELDVCIHQNHVFRARAFLSDLPSKFVSFFANALGQTYFMGEGKQTTNLASISLTKLKAFPVPVPPPGESEAIVEEADALLTDCDNIEAQMQKGRDYSNSLRQSVLQTAFSGKLVPQDPNDEPASVLLKRIAAERASRDETKPKRNRRQKVSA